MAQNPACSCYVITSSHRFGPYSVAVHLDLEWIIRGSFYWRNPLDEPVLVQKVLMVSPIGNTYLDSARDVEVGAYQDMETEIAVVNHLDNSVPFGEFPL